MSDATNPAWLVENEDGSISVSFETRPPKIDGTEVKVVRMREPLVDDQLTAERGSKSAADSEVALISNLCEISPEAVRALTLRQYSRLQTALSVFFG